MKGRDISVRDGVKSRIVKELAKRHVSVREQVRLWYGHPEDKCVIEFMPVTDDDVFDVAVEVYGTMFNTEGKDSDMVKLEMLAVAAPTMDAAWDKVVSEVLTRIKNIIVKSRSETAYGATRYTERRVRFPKYAKCGTLEELAIHMAVEE